MRSIIGRNLVNLCFTNFKRSVPIESSYFYQDQEDGEEDEDGDRRRSANASTITKTFNSLYDLTNFSTPKPLITHTETPSASFDNADSPATTPDIATVYASHRFFFASPGRSNSIVDSSSSLSLTSPSSSNPPGEEDPPESDADVGGVAVPTYSPDPYLDFRRSMEEMVEARNLFDVRSNWECLHELLLCYLALNPKTNHKFIVGAFSDLLVSLMDSQSGYNGGGRGGGGL